MTSGKAISASKLALILPSGGDAKKALDRALGYLAPGGDLWIVQTPGGLVPSAVSSWMIYLGFMGDRPSGDYVEIAMEEFRRRVRERLDDLQSICDDRGVACQTVLLEGDTVRVVMEWVQEHEPDAVVFAMPEVFDPERDFFVKLAGKVEHRFPLTFCRI
jgi:hypothetical protein